jgi:hypothetical protein
MREVFPVSDPQDVQGLLGMEHLGKLVASLRSRADLVVIQSPAVSESAESYLVCAVADRTLLVAGAGSSADSVVTARDQMERVGVSLLGVAFVERPRRRRAATRATSRNGAAGVRAADVFTARSMGPTAPAARHVTTGDNGEEPTTTMNGQATDARSSEAAAAPDASSKRLDETTPSVDPESRVSQL